MNARCSALALFVTLTAACSLFGAVDHEPPAGWRDARAGSSATLELGPGAHLVLGVSDLQALRAHGGLWLDVRLDPGASDARIESVEFLLFDDVDGNSRHDTGEREFGARHGAGPALERRTWTGFGGAERLAHPIIEVRVTTNLGEHVATLPIESTTQLAP